MYLLAGLAAVLRLHSAAISASLPARCRSMLRNRVLRNLHTLYHAITALGCESSGKLSSTDLHGIHRLVVVARHHGIARVIELDPGDVA